MKSYDRGGSRSSDDIQAWSITLTPLERAYLHLPRLIGLTAFLLALGYLCWSYFP